MPEEDDEALGQMLGDRLKGAKDEDEREVEEGPPASTTVAQSTEETEGTESTQITQSTESTAPPTGEGENASDAVRTRSPFPLYVSDRTKGEVHDRFEKFNAQRTLNDEPQVEKHKHFMEGLLRAGLDHPDFEDYVLEEFEKE